MAFVLVLVSTGVQWLWVFLSLVLSGVLLIRSRQDAANRFAFGGWFWKFVALVVLVALIFKTFLSESWLAMAAGIVALCLEIAVMWHWTKSE